jgi:hypothetical protein
MSSYIIDILNKDIRRYLAFFLDNDSIKNNIFFQDLKNDSKFQQEYIDNRFLQLRHDGVHSHCISNKDIKQLDGFGKKENDIHKIAISYHRNYVSDNSFRSDLEGMFNKSCCNFKHKLDLIYLNKGGTIHKSIFNFEDKIINNVIYYDKKENLIIMNKIKEIFNSYISHLENNIKFKNIKNSNYAPISTYTYKNYYFYISIMYEKVIFRNDNGIHEEFLNRALNIYLNKYIYNFDKNIHRGDIFWIKCMYDYHADGLYWIDKDKNGYGYKLIPCDPKINDSRGNIPSEFIILDPFPYNYFDYFKHPSKNVHETEHNIIFNMHIILNLKNDYIKDIDIINDNIAFLNLDIKLICLILGKNNNINDSDNKRNISDYLSNDTITIKRFPDLYDELPDKYKYNLFRNDVWMIYQK